MPNTTYEFEMLSGDIVEVGDKSSGDFKPHIKLNRWDGECWLALKPAGEIEEVEYEVESDKIKCKYKVKQGEFEFEWESEFYPLEPTNGQNELGGFEFEIILKKKPAKNTIVLDIETQGLKFYYQPTLTQQDIADGAIRPDNVVGSYAVYHATRTPMHASKEDAEKYKCGIFGMCYCPKITDADGKWIWGELSLDEQAGTLTTTIDQDFLDSAVYPVTIDPNFGIEVEGGTIGTLLDDRIYTFSTTTYSPAGDGTLTSMSIYAYDSGEHIKMAIYDSSDESMDGETVEATLGAASAKVDANASGTPSVYAAKAYRLAFNGDGNLYHIKYNSGAAAATWKYEANNYDPTPFTNPASWTDAAANSENLWSIFATYSEEEPPVTEAYGYVV